ncbi:MAG: ABC transporter ATP-binding protein [Spirochaetales bacterium]|nr:ABC transporter ATP-binding protein [Spirochaetales bacterium]
MLNALEKVIKIFKWIFPYLKTYKKRIIAIFLCTLGASVITTLLPLLNKYIIDDGLIQGNFPVVVTIVFMFLALFTVQKLIEFLEIKFYSYTHAMISFRLLKDSFKHILNLKLNFFSRTNSTQVLNNTRADIANISILFDKNTFYLVTQVLQMIGALTGLIILDYRLTLVTIGLIPLRYFLIKTLIVKREKLFRRYIQLQSDFSRWYGDIVDGIKEIKLTCMEQGSFGQFIARQREIIKIQITMAFYDKLNQTIESIVVILITNCLYIIGGWFIIGGQLTLGSLMAFLSYSIYLTMPVAGILNMAYLASGITPSMERLKSFLSTDGEKRYHSQSIKPVARHNQQGVFSFDHVCFSYGENQFSLKDISFTIPNGKKIALVGENGAGKTTLINLLLRFHYPDKGKILLDGTDIREYKLKEYRNLFAVVSQDLYLFDTTILENIQPMGKGQSIKLSEAAKRSQAYAFIENLPHKYSTRVGKNGTLLSGGQRQRVALARALAREGEIIIFDEATSHCDADTEISIHDLLDENLKTKTMIVITHKPLVLKKMDKIIVLGKGKVEDTGNHEELLARNLYYRNMVNVYGTYPALKIPG